MTGHRPRKRVHAPLALLLLSIGVVAIAVFEVHRAAVSQRDVADEVLREYALFAGWSYQQHAREAVRRMAAPVLGSVHMGGHVHDRPPIPTAETMPHMLPWDPECFCHRDRYMPSAIFAFTLGVDTLGVASNTYVHPERGWLGDPSSGAGSERSALRAELRDYGAVERAWIVDTLTTHVRSIWRPDWSLAFVLGSSPADNDHFLAYTIMRTAWGDTMVYGFEYAPATIAQLFDDLLDQEGLLPAPLTRDRPNADLLAVEVTDPVGRPLYASAAPSAWQLDAVTPFPDFFGGLRVRTEVRPEMAADLVIGGLPRSRLPLLVALLGIAAALAAVSVRQLRREQELARLRSDFVSSVSHELRTPLTQIRLFLETLRLGRFTTDAQREWSLGNIDRETKRLVHLVENVLQFSRGRAIVPERLARVDVGREVELAARAFEPIAAARRSTLEVHVDDAVEAALDADAFRQVLTNLFDNAVKFGPADQTVRVRVQHAGERARVSVEDEGPGVPEAERDAVWTPFYRGATPAARAAGGSGIGLAIVRDIVHAHGGRVGVESGEAGGARFVIDLPATAAAAPVESGSMRDTHANVP